MFFVKLNDNEFNENKIINTNKESIFNSNKENLDISLENIKIIEIEIYFTGIKQGSSYNYYEKFNYTLEKQIKLGNEIWDRMMSV